RRPVVMDFGIARVGKGAGLTIQGTLIGTPAYMPPEQAGDEPDKIGPHSDVYSLGAILYTLLTGKAPFHEETAMRTILKVVSSDSPPSIRALRPEVSPRLERVCFKALHKDFTRRYPTAQAFAKAVRKTRAAGQAPGEKPSDKTPSSGALRLPVVVVLEGPAGRQVRLS